MAAKLNENRIKPIDKSPFVWYNTRTRGEREGSVFRCRNSGDFTPKSGSKWDPTHFAVTDGSPDFKIFMPPRGGGMGITMNILIIDAQGGGVGKQLVAAAQEIAPDANVTAVGTNTAATAAMLKAGADIAATGENAVVVACRRADVIMGPIGIVIADSLWGEVTPMMATAVGSAEAKRILIPFNNCDNVIAGVPEYSLGRLIDAANSELSRIVNA